VIYIFRWVLYGTATAATYIHAWRFRLLQLEWCSVLECSLLCVLVSLLKGSLAKEPYKRAWRLECRATLQMPLMVQIQWGNCYNWGMYNFLRIFWDFLYTWMTLNALIHFICKLECNRMVQRGCNRMVQHGCNTLSSSYSERNPFFCFSSTRTGAAYVMRSCMTHEWHPLRGGGLGSSTIFKKFNEPYAPS